MSIEGYNDILPDDGNLLDRVKLWSEFCEKYSFDRLIKMDCSIKDVPHFEDSVEYSSDSLEEFEDNSIPDEEQDPDFDVQKVFDSTLQIVHTRENNWRRNGIDQAMESFDVNTAEKVQNWIRSNDKYYNKLNSFKPIELKSDVERHNKEFTNETQDFFSEDESLQSVNTAKYILTNRKKVRSTNFASMTTIKNFCCYNKQHNISETQNTNNLKVRKPSQQIENTSQLNHYPLERIYNRENENSSQKLRQKVKFKRKNKFYYSCESSDDTTDQSTSNRMYKTKSKLGPKSYYMYKYGKINSKKKDVENAKIRKRFDKEKLSLRFYQDKTRRSGIALCNEMKNLNGSFRSEVNFNVNSIINSTEISKSANKKLYDLDYKSYNKFPFIPENSYTSDDSSMQSATYLSAKNRAKRIRERPIFRKEHEIHSLKEQNSVLQRRNINNTAAKVKQQQQRAIGDPTSTKCPADRYFELRRKIVSSEESILNETSSDISSCKSTMENVRSQKHSVKEWETNYKNNPGSEKSETKQPKLKFIDDHNLSSSEALCIEINKNKGDKRKAISNEASSDISRLTSRRAAEKVIGQKHNGQANSVKVSQLNNRKKSGKKSGKKFSDEISSINSSASGSTAKSCISQKRIVQENSITTRGTSKKKLGNEFSHEISNDIISSLSSWSKESCTSQNRNREETCIKTSKTNIKIKPKNSCLDSENNENSALNKVEKTKKPNCNRNLKLNSLKTIIEESPTSTKLVKKSSLTKDKFDEEIYIRSSGSEKTLNSSKLNLKLKIKKSNGRKMKIEEKPKDSSSETVRTNSYNQKLDSLSPKHRFSPEKRQTLNKIFRLQEKNHSELFLNVNQTNVEHKDNDQLKNFSTLETSFKIDSPGEFSKNKDEKKTGSDHKSQNKKLELGKSSQSKLYGNQVNISINKETLTLSKKPLRTSTIKKKTNEMIAPSNSENNISNINKNPSTPNMSSRRFCSDSLRNSYTNKSSMLKVSFSNKEQPHIMLYDPMEKDDTIKYLEPDQIIIDELTLKNKIGLELAEKFLAGKKPFMKKFDNKSTIIFILPSETDCNNTDSEVDVLERFTGIAANENGKIAEILTYKKYK